MTFPLLLKHPMHGAMHAYDSGEAERLKKLGWAEEAVVVPPKAPEVVTKRKYVRKTA